MLGVTIIGRHSHVDSPTLGEVRHRLVFLWQLFPDGLQGDFQLDNRLRPRLKFMVLFPTVTVKWVQILRVWGHSFFSVSQGQFVCS